MGRVVGLGLGPGDPELISVKAARILAGAEAIAYFRKKGRTGQARMIVEGLFQPGAREIALDYPFTTEVALDDPDYAQGMGRFYAEAAERILAEAARVDVVVLCEGDPFFYGSFMHVHRRLVGRIPVEVVPGITGMSGCWTEAGTPMTWGDDVLTVLPGTLSEDALADALARTDAAVVMKLGRNLGKVRRALDRAGLTSRAVYVERGTMPGGRVVPLAELAGAEAPYFSMVLVPGGGRRP